LKAVAASNRLVAVSVCKRLKDGREVETRDGVVMTTDDNTHRLVIRETLESDAGVYKCVVRNSSGETACTATLSVDGRLCASFFVINL